LATNLGNPVSIAYPKKPNNILVRATNRDIEGGLAGAVQEKKEISLDQLLSNYLTRLGMDSAFTSGIIVQLLTNGKVRVDFSNVAERLELVNKSDITTPPQAISLFEDYINSSLHPEEKGKRGKKTARIEVQKPRR